MQRRILDGANSEQQLLWEPRSVGQRLRRLRKQRGWSQSVLAFHFLVIAKKYRRAIRNDSLTKMISKWEGDRVVPDHFNRQVLALALGVTVEEFGLFLDPDDVVMNEYALYLQEVMTEIAGRVRAALDNIVDAETANS
jgi:transcriptional regulator with XRE-family HTH domain